MNKFIQLRAVGKRSAIVHCVLCISQLMCTRVEYLQQSNPIQSTFVKRHQSSCLFRGASQKHRGKPLLLTIKCTGFFYVYYTTHGTYSFTSHPKDEAIMVKCLAQGHKCRYRESKPTFWFSDNTRTWVRCTRPLGQRSLAGIVHAC